MPTNCAIFRCPSQHQKDSDIHFFRFPKEEPFRQIWAKKCGPRPKPVNPNTAYICSLHFSQHDYDQWQLMRRKLMGSYYRLKLNKDAVPTLCLPSAKNPEAKNAIPQHNGCNEGGEMIVIEINQCRICLGTIRNNSGSNIFKGIINNELLSSIMANVADIKVAKDDGLPNSICRNCCRKLHETYSFRTVIRKSDVELRKKSVLDVIYQDDVAVDDFDNQDETVIIVEEHPPDEELEKPPESDIHEDGEFRVPNNAVVDVKKITNHNASKQIAKNKVVCPECGKILKTSTYLAKHMATHKKEPHLCAKCGIVSRQLRYLKTHIENHTKKRQFSCDRCPKNFQTNYRLQLHKRVHSDKSAYVCERCGKGFRFRTGLVSHISIHDTEWYGCKLCGKQFKQKTVLGVHMKGAHPVGGRLKCEHCDQTFKNRATLKRHSVRHSVQVPGKKQVETPNEELLVDGVIFGDMCFV